MEEGGFATPSIKEKRKDRPSKKGVKKSGSEHERRNATDKV